MKHFLQDAEEHAFNRDYLHKTDLYSEPV